MMSYLCPSHRDYALFRQAWAFSYTSNPEVWRRIVKSLCVNMMPVQICSMVELAAFNPTIAHNKAAM